MALALYTYDQCQDSAPVDRVGPYCGSNEGCKLRPPNLAMPKILGGTSSPKETAMIKLMFGSDVPGYSGGCNSLLVNGKPCGLVGDIPATG
jgi:hypothetical protein